MNSTTSRPKKSPSSKARRKRAAGILPAVPSSARRPAGARKGQNFRQDAGSTLSLRREFREWRASLPTKLERDTLLWPEVIAETVVQEAERFLNAELPADFAERLAAKAYYLYPRHKQFHKILNRPGNRGRDSLYMFMRHWTASWLKRERYALFKRLPWEYSLGQRLPVSPPACPRIIPNRRSW